MPPVSPALHRSPVSIPRVCPMPLRRNPTPISALAVNSHFPSGCPRFAPVGRNSRISSDYAMRRMLVRGEGQLAGINPFYRTRQSGRPRCARLSLLPPRLPKAHSQSRADFSNDPDRTLVFYPTITLFSILNEEELPRHPSGRQNGKSDNDGCKKFVHCYLRFSTASLYFLATSTITSNTASTIAIQSQ